MSHYVLAACKTCFKRQVLHYLTWDGLHVSPRAAPSKGPKLCTYHHWFGRPNKVHCEPHYELPMSITRLQALGSGWGHILCLLSKAVL